MTSFCSLFKAFIASTPSILSSFSLTNSIAPMETADLEIQSSKRDSEVSAEVSAAAGPHETLMKSCPPGFVDLV